MLTQRFANRDPWPQHVVNRLFVGRGSQFALDRAAQLFQSMHGSEGELALGRERDGSPTLTNTRTATRPLVLHFNGGGKPHFKKYLSHVLSGAPCLPTNRTVHVVPGGAKSFRDVCPRHALPRKACAE